MAAREKTALTDFLSKCAQKSYNVYVCGIIQICRADEAVSDFRHWKDMENTLCSTYLKK